MSDEPCIHLLDPDTCTVCNGRDERERRRDNQVLARWSARYSGRINCGCWVEVGDPIARLGDDRIVCADHTNPQGATR